MKKENAEKELSYPVDVRTITGKGKHVRFTASENECKALAKRFELPAVKDLSVNIRIKKVGFIQMEGEIKARITQTDVVTLEPFDSVISEKFRVFFEVDKPENIRQAIDIDMDDEEIEPVRGGIIDCGAVAAEQFGLALDPFPKKSKKVFVYEDPLSKEEEKALHPFAGLKKLIKS